MILDRPDGQFKFCPDCRQELPVSAFTRDTRRSDGLAFYCTVCRNVRDTASRRRRNGSPRTRAGLGPKSVPAGQKWCPECGEVKALAEFPHNRSQQSGYGSYCKPCHNRITRENKEKNGGARNYHLRRRYGITVEHFDQMSAEQNGLCGICREAPGEHVDHDHVTKLVRGLLCFNCNGALGQFRDRTDLMLRAVAYLRRDAVPDWAEPNLHYYLGDFADPRPPDEPRVA